MNTTHENYLSELKSFFADARVCRDCSRLVEHFSIRLAALGEAEQVLAIVKQSPEAELFISLAEGLRLHLGQPTCVESEAAREIAAQIQEEAAGFAYASTPASMAA
ncbi:MAG TPA: hypothetical protein VFB27_06180 [Opitutaceae bacterium]|nr:hypothetical protein [Opitutaceae bacterium]